MMPDTRFASQNGRVRIHGNLIFQVGVPLIGLAAAQLAQIVLDQRIEGSQRDAVIERDAAPDGGCFSDDHTRAVIDEKRFANGSAGVNVDAGMTVRGFRHHARDVGDFQTIEPMRQALHGNGLDARIAEQHLLQTRGGGVAAVGGVDV
jgi:hypothetical protein